MNIKKFNREDYIKDSLYFPLRTEYSTDQDFYNALKEIQDILLAAMLRRKE